MVGFPVTGAGFARVADGDVSRHSEHLPTKNLALMLGKVQQARPRSYVQTTVTERLGRERPCPQLVAHIWTAFVSFEDPGSENPMYRAFGVTVTVPAPNGAPSVAPLVVVANDERDAELVAARIAGNGASAETLRELTAQEAVEYGLDLNEPGNAKALPILNF